MLSRLLSIASNTFVETIRQPIYGVLLLVTAFLLILNIFLAGFTLQDDDKLLLDLNLSTILLSGLFLSAFSATGILTREIENKTVLTIISKPITRLVFLAGKYLGLIGAQVVAFYLSFLILVLCVHHSVLQMSSDPWDWPAIILGAGSGVLAIVIAALANYFYGREFCSTCIALAVPMMTVGTIITAFFDREWNRDYFMNTFHGGELFVLAILIFFAIAIIAAVALAASTRLGQVMTLMVCVLVLMAGLLSDWNLGQHRESSALASVFYHVIPNMNFFWVVDALNVAGEVPISYILQTGLYTLLIVTAILLVGVALFQRREVG